MTAAERELLYTHMMGMDEFESKLILHEPADTSDTQVFLNRLAAPSQATEMSTLAADEAETEPGRTAEAEVDDGKGRMSLSADAPSYDTACEELDTEPTEPGSGSAIKYEASRHHTEEVASYGGMLDASTRSNPNACGFSVRKLAALPTIRQLKHLKLDSPKISDTMKSPTARHSKRKYRRLQGEYAWPLAFFLMRCT
jgi:hypothetical protein